jgi:hypothetical protein
VQIIETSDLGVRAAILRMRRPDIQSEFILFPMLHLASPDFYSAIQTRLRECDLILVEGVNTIQVQLLTLAYRTPSRSKHLGLVTQGEGLDLSPFLDRLIHADLTAGEFERGWREVPLYLRLVLLCFAPLYGLYLRYFGTRDLIARYAEFNDLPSRDEVLSYDRDFDQLQHALLGQRDARLTLTIERVIQELGPAPKTVGILFGAEHMRAVIRYLTEKQGYHAASAEWLTVFEF